MTKTLLAVDGNSLVHRSFHALLSSNLRTSDGRASWAVKGFLSQLLGVVDRFAPDAIVIGFDDHTNSVRKTQWPHYKATRKPKPPELGEQLAGTADLMRRLGLHVVVPAGLEADDVLASAGRTAAAAGWRTVVVTSDRDSFALIDDTTSVLRLITGGVEASPLLTPDRLVTMYGIRPDQYREYAAMRGDTSDNLAGIVGVGEKTAAKLLAAFGTVAAAFADVDAGGTQVAAELGKAAVGKLAKAENREAFARNVEIMTMRTDLDLGLDLTGTGTSGHLPLPAEQVTAALEHWELRSLLGSATNLLTSAPAPREQLDRSPAPEPAPEPAPATAGPAVHAHVTTGAFGRSTAPRPAVWADSLF